MSQSRGADEDTDMAISYTQPSTGHPHQTLPSFRELLPAHLHHEIESTSPYYTSPRQERPGSGHEMTDPRSIPHGSHAKMPYELHREYTTREHLPDAHMRLSEARPSPILPPIRDLDAIPGRPTTQSRDGYPERDPYQDYRPMPMDQHYAPVMHQSPYGPGYEEQVSPVPHGANFGIMGDAIDPKTKRRRGNLPKPVTDILRAWFHEHLDHPYPSEEDKQMFMTRTGLSINQISNWFINARRRQLPALRNQMRGADESQRHSPFSDMDGSEHLPSPRH